MEMRKMHGRGHRHVLAHLRGLRQRRDRGRLSGGRHRAARRLARLRPDGAHHGLRHRPHLGLPSQPRGDGRPCGRRAFPGEGSVPYVVAQVVGAVVGAAVLYLIASGGPGFDLAKGFAANGYGEHSPGKYALSPASSPRSCSP